VREGESIQAALDAADPGETVLVHRGTYRESLQIDTDGIRLKGNHVRLLEPASPGDTICNQLEPVTGICVVGQGDLEAGEIIDYVSRVRIKGFTIEGFSGTGIFAVGSELLRVSHDKLLENGGCGVFALVSKRPHYLHNLSSDNAAPGLYVGDSPEANVVVRHNRSLDNTGEGILLRSAVGGKVSQNTLEGNCAGLLALADAPGPVGSFQIVHNRVLENNRACPGEPAEDEPPISGLGIAVLGAFATGVSHNKVTGNQATGDSFVSGGIAVTAGPGGTEPQDVVIGHNKAFDNDNLPNDAFDLFWDLTGSVAFTKNRCATSDPDGLCTRGAEEGEGEGQGEGEEGQEVEPHRVLRPYAARRTTSTFSPKSPTPQARRLRGPHGG
jgi:nitrous oxidase accessory protein NosD